jgi:uncharacterized membrane protein
VIQSIDDPKLKKGTIFWGFAAVVLTNKQYLNNMLDSIVIGWIAVLIAVIGFGSYAVHLLKDRQQTPLPWIH